MIKLVKEVPKITDWMLTSVCDALDKDRHLMVRCIQLHSKYFE